MYRANEGPCPFLLGAILRLLPLLTVAACAQVTIEEGIDVDALPRLSLTEVTRLGSLTDADVGFTAIRDIDVDDEGRLYVLEASEYAVRVYDPEGHLLRRIGRRGDGPGEFRLPAEMGVVGDTVWVFDARARHTTLFSRAGELLGIPLATERIATSDPDVEIVYYARGLRHDGRFTAADLPSDWPTNEIVYPEVLLDATGAIVDTIGWDTLRPPGPRALTPGSVITIGTPTPPSYQPFTIRLEDDRIDVDPGTPTAEVGHFSLTRLARSGDTVFHRLFRYRPIPYTDAILDSMVASAAEGIARESGESARQVAANMRKARTVPELQVLASGYHVGSDGVLWLTRENISSPTREHILIGPDGTPRGVVETPRGAAIHWSDGDDVWAIEHDDFDVPYLVRYRIAG